MSSLADRLPSRFPVGTRYVVEGRGGSRGQLRIRSRYLEFPDGRQIDLSVEPAARRRAGPRRTRRAGTQK
jgi:hypothetical protein